MCSICEYFSNEKIPTSIVSQMLSKMEHRGPDGSALFADGKIIKKDEIGKQENQTLAKLCLGHSKLSIKGDEDAIQPIQSCDGKLFLALNGEIYNNNELSELLGRHHEIIDHNNNCETLLHLIEELYNGDLLGTVQSIVKMLNGMYVFAVTNGEEIVIARDPMGIKPLYYTENNNVVYFSSEKKAIWELGKPDRILPGHILRINEDGLTLKKAFWIERPSIDIKDFTKAVDQYQNNLISAIEKRVSGLNHEEMGIIFSGGVDSVLIAKILSNMGLPLRCYCVGNEGSQDIEYAKMAAKDLNLELKIIIIDSAIVESILPEIIETIEINGLLQVEVAVPMYLAARAASMDGIKVMFTGQGADELFAGYAWYKDVVQNQGFVELHDNLWDDIDLAYDDTLEREDKVTMAHSVELRVPYLDREVVRTAMRISPKLKVKKGDDAIRKWVHRKTAEILGVPDYIAYRTKDPAQSGSGIHMLIKEIAEEFFDGIKFEHVRTIDKGSNYRYLNEEYGTPEMWAYMHEMSKGINAIEV